MQFMPYSDDTNTSGSKFLLDCQDITNSNPTTDGWLENISFLSIIPSHAANRSHKKILEGIFHKTRHVVVKIADIEEDIAKEWDTYNILKNARLPGMLTYYCFFRCNDDIIKYKRQQLSLCQGTGDALQVLVMEYVRSKSFKHFAWKDVSEEVFQSCLQQAVLTQVNAFITSGFLHGDFHLDNILIKKTTRKTMTYDALEVTVQLHGWQTKLMDFELSKFDKDNVVSLWDNLKCFYRKLLGDLVEVLEISKIDSIISLLGRLKEDKVSDITYFATIYDLTKQIKYKTKLYAKLPYGGKLKKPDITKTLYRYGRNRHN